MPWETINWRLSVAHSGCHETSRDLNLVASITRAPLEALGITIAECRGCTHPLMLRKPCSNATAGTVNKNTSLGYYTLPLMLQSLQMSLIQFLKNTSLTNESGQTSPVCLGRLTSNTESLRYQSEDDVCRPALFSYICSILHILLRSVQKIYALFCTMCLQHGL